MTTVRNNTRPVAISIPVRLTTTLPDIGLHAMIRGEEYEFTLSWNKDYNYYSMAISSRSANRIKKWYPATHDPIEIRNFNLLDPNFPHATVYIEDRSGREADLTPLANGSHNIVVIPWGEITY